MIEDFFDHTCDIYHNVKQTVSTLLDKDVLIIPKSVTGLTAGSKVYITQAGAGGKFIIIGRG